MESFHWDNLLKCIELVWNWRIHKPSDHFYCPRPNYNACLPTNKNDKKKFCYIHVALCSIKSLHWWIQWWMGRISRWLGKICVGFVLIQWRILKWRIFGVVDAHNFFNSFTEYIHSLCVFHGFHSKKIECLGLIVNNQALRTVHLLLLLLLQ